MNDEQIGSNETTTVYFETLNCYDGSNFLYIFKFKNQRSESFNNFEWYERISPILLY